VTGVQTCALPIYFHLAHVLQRITLAMTDHALDPGSFVQRIRQLLVVLRLSREGRRMTLTLLMP
jgi:hypothetical protein